MVRFQYNLFLQYPSLLMLTLISLCFSTALIAVDANQDTTIFDVGDLSNEPVSLYNYLKISEGADFESIEDNSFVINKTKDNYNPEAEYVVQLRLTNNSLDNREILLNFSPNNWNESWDLITARVYTDSLLVKEITSGYKLNSEDKPVQSAMNLMRLKVSPQDHLKIVVSLKGSAIHSKNTPRHIDFTLLKESQSAGLIADYPFKGEYVNRKSQVTFVANHLINHDIYQDKSRTKTIHEIEKSWKSLETKDLFNTPHEDGTVYWLKLSLTGTPLFNGEQIFEISNAPNWSLGGYNPVSDQFSFDYIDGYYRNSNQELIHQRAGDHVDMRERSMRFWANFLTVDIPLGETVDLFVRLEGADPRFPLSSIVMYHIDPSSLFPRQVNEGWTHGLYYGALGIYLLFFFLLFIVERERLYLYFSIAILGLLMINIFPEDIYTRYVVFPSWRDYHVPLYFLGVFVLAFGFLKFTERYLLIDKSSTISRFVIPGFLTTMGIAAVVVAIFFKYTPEVGNPLFEPYMLTFIFLQLVSFILPLCIAIIAKNQKGFSKLSYFISFLPLVIAAIFYFGHILLPNFSSAQDFRSSEEVNRNYNFIQMGVAAMLTLFAMNVGFRTNRLKADKEQAEQLAAKNVIIEAKSKQNETLLKEIHHRVKNNLQTISSLLYLQSYGEKNEQTKENIAVTQQRVESMALIHKNLYQRDNLAAIEMKEYIKNLCESLISSYQSSTKKVKLKLEIPEFELDIDRAIPMGLIINEIVTNSLKYAFPPNYNGELRINLDESDDNKYSFLIADNGMGKSADAEPSFGSQLIQLLTKQIDVEVSSGNDEGYWIQLTLSK